MNSSARQVSNRFCVMRRRRAAASESCSPAGHRRGIPTRVLAEKWVVPESASVISCSVGQLVVLGSLLGVRAAGPRERGEWGDKRAGSGARAEGPRTLGRRSEGLRPAGRGTQSAQVPLSINEREGFWGISGWQGRKSKGLWDMGGDLQRLSWEATTPLSQSGKGSETHSVLLRLVSMVLLTVGSVVSRVPRASWTQNLAPGDG